MGSLKDEKRGLSLGDNHQPSDKSDNKGYKMESESSAATEGQPLHMSQELTTQEGHLANSQMNTSSEARDKNPTSKAKGLSVDSETSYQSVPEQTKDCTQNDAMPLTPNTTDKQSNATVSVDFLGNGDVEDRCDREAKNISVPLPPSTPDSFDPLSPAPFGHHHMRTQVSLEVVQCHSVATSPMTLPEDSHSFFFPSTFGKTGNVATATKDAELQVGKQGVFSSVATSPMTPKTPSTTAFPMFVGGFGQDQETKCQEAELEMTESYSLSKPPGSSRDYLAAKSVGGTCEDINPQCKQQRMGSMDQDITILVTQYGNNEEVEEEKKEESQLHSIVPDMVKIDEYEEVGENNRDRKKILDPVQSTSNSNDIHKQPEEPKDCSKSENVEVTEIKGVNVEPIDVYGTKPTESSAPFGCHNIHTQVSLEVVQCQSVATSPMTPPEGDQAFYFPSFGKGQSMGTVTKDAEMQVGQLVELRSVATAPMTPRTPIATIFPEINKDTSMEGKIVEEDKIQKEQVMESKDEDEEFKEEEKVEKNKVTNCKERDEEPVQEVSWDEKGMTWEVYGAVVEVAVLGSAIQKHLEKQVMKQKQQYSVPPADPSESDQEGSVKGLARKTDKQDGKESRRRRNPFRVLMENVQQPHCCSRAHSSE